MKIVHSLMYAAYNLLYLGLMSWALVFANTYLNPHLVPSGLKWKVDGTLREDLTWYFVVLFVLFMLEAFLLQVIIFFANRRFLEEVAKVESSVTVAVGTGIAAMVMLALLAWVTIFNY